MLKDHEAVATVAVKDIAVARKFYEGTLGLKLAPGQQKGTLALESGRSKIFVYPSQYAGTNQATAVTWLVGDDIEKIVQELRAKGVVFEHYPDLPDTTIQGDLHVQVSGSLKVAWLKDPDGNVLGLVNG